MARIIDVPDIRMLCMQADVQRQIANLEASRAATDDALKAAFAVPAAIMKRPPDEALTTTPEPTMTQEQSRIPSMIEERIRKQCRPIAQAATKELEPILFAHMAKIGTDPFEVKAGKFLYGMEERHMELLVADRMRALVDGLTAPEAEPVESVSLGDFVRQAFGVDTDPAQLIEEASAKTVQAGEGDTVVLSMKHMLSSDARAKVAAWAAQSLPAGVKVLVLDNGVTLDVVKGK